MNSFVKSIKNPRVAIAIWFVAALFFSIDVYLYKVVMPRKVELFNYTVASEVVEIDLPNAIDLGIKYEFCILPSENIDPVAQFVAGTPIPYEPVPISTQIVNKQPTEIYQIQVTSIPSAIPTQNNYSDLEIVNVGNYNKNNFHFVLVGVGYADNNGIEMRKIIDNFNGSFAGINADFAYVESSIDLDFKHIQQLVNFENESDQEALFDAIKRVYPVDGLVIAINTPLFLGTSHGNAAMLTSNDPNTILIATHEMGHQLGLDDGYQTFYEEGSLPSTELFYIDEMPSRLVSALKKMDRVPSLYKVGTCNSKSVYSFYESNNNVMRDYSPSQPKSWGDTTFTPLQIILMNDYIEWYKEVYK